MKLALVLHDAPADARRLAAAMRDAQRHEPGCADRELPFAFGCLALLGRPDEDPAAWPVWVGADGSFLAFAGLPVRSGTGSPGPVRAADPLVQGALDGGDPAATHRMLAELDGAFVGVWWSAPRGTLTVVTDFLGMQPLYRADAGGTMAFASEMKAFAAAGVVPAAPDAGAWGAMLLFGHQIGPRALLAGATRVAPARRLAFARPAGGGGPVEAAAASTWTWPASRGVPDGPALRDDVGHAVRADVAAYAAAYPDAALLLSGGFDSRLILCLCRELGLRPRLLVQGHPDENADADARFALAFARTLGLPVRHAAARADFYGTGDYLRFLERNEVATPSLGLFIPNVAPLVQPERHGVWEGLLLDPALKFDAGAGGFDEYLAGRLRARRAHREALRLVFAPAFARQVEEEFDALVAEERGRFADDAEGVWRFSVLNRSRYRTGVNPYQVYDTVTPPLTPGMSRRFWEVVSAADPAARFGKRLYRAVFDRLAPDGLRVPIATGSTLLPGSGGAAVYHETRLRAAVQQLARRPRIDRWLRRAGLPTPFAWAPSPFPDRAVAEAALDDGRLNADWIRAARSGGEPGDAVAREVLMYWQAWHHALRGDLARAWGPRDGRRG